MMRRHSWVGRIIAALSTALILAGCTHAHRAGPLAAGVDLDDMNAKLAGRLVLLKLADGTELHAHNVRVSADSVFMQPQMLREADWWLAPGRALPVSGVRSLEVTGRGRGSLDGALLGLGIGAVGGAAIGAAVFEPSSGGLSTMGEAAFVGGIILGVLGTCLGFLVGASRGSTDVYDLTRVPDVTGPASPGE